MNDIAHGIKTSSKKRLKAFTSPTDWTLNSNETRFSDLAISSLKLQSWYFLKCPLQSDVLNIILATAAHRQITLLESTCNYKRTFNSVFCCAVDIPHSHRGQTHTVFGSIGSMGITRSHESVTNIIQLQHRFERCEPLERSSITFMTFNSNWID